MRFCVYDLSPFVLRELFYRDARPEHPGVVHERVYPAEPFYRLVYQLLYVAAVGNVRRDREDFRAFFFDLLRNRLYRVFAPRVHDDFRALFRASQRESLAEPLARAGYEYYLFFQHGNSSVFWFIRSCNDESYGSVAAQSTGSEAPVGRVREGFSAVFCKFIQLGV